MWRAHHCWLRLRRRCTDPKSPDFENYGGRGIAYDPAWDDFKSFIADMGLPPPGLTIERIDVNGPYSRLNCRWADRGEQSRNRRNARLVEHAGKTMRIGEWAAYFGVPVTTIKNRVYRGQSFAGLIPRS
jgi:hypothetical protein